MAEARAGGLMREESIQSIGTEEKKVILRLVARYGVRVV
jgi:hypothetical protein